MTVYCVHAANCACQSLAPNAKHSLWKLVLNGWIFFRGGFFSILSLVWILAHLLQWLRSIFCNHFCFCFRLFSPFFFFRFCFGSVSLFFLSCLFDVILLRVSNVFHIKFDCEVQCTPDAERATFSFLFHWHFYAMHSLDWYMFHSTPRYFHSENAKFQLRSLHLHWSFSCCFLIKFAYGFSKQKESIL